MTSLKKVEDDSRRFAYASEVVNQLSPWGLISMTPNQNHLMTMRVCLHTVDCIQVMHSDKQTTKVMVHHNNISNHNLNCKNFYKKLLSILGNFQYFHSLWYVIFFYFFRPCNASILPCLQKDQKQNVCKKLCSCFFPIILPVTFNFSLFYLSSAE